MKVVVVIPFVEVESLFFISLALKAVVGRGGLHIGVACGGNIFHIFFNGVKRPAPSMENGFCVGGFA